MSEVIANIDEIDFGYAVHTDKLNSYGLDFSDPNKIVYRKDGFQLEAIDFRFQSSSSLNIHLKLTKEGVTGNVRMPHLDLFQDVQLKKLAKRIVE